MKSVDVVICITRCTVEITEICMRTLFTFRISGLFSEAEMKFIVGKVSQWTANVDHILKELSLVVAPGSGIPFEEVSGPAQIWLATLEEHTRLARLFEKRFRVLCLDKIRDSSLQSDLELLFIPGEESKLFDESE
ncbi:hypothetical protein [Chitinophaga sp. YIM B06452]|uniref:hypothetical protein n=1 Tax=Chitinophaga sp. YIM B06452 TaxID=3082158 RepID=UPI0031FE53ED